MIYEFESDLNRSLGEFKRDLRGIQGEEEKGFFSNSLLGKR